MRSGMLTGRIGILLLAICPLLALATGLYGGAVVVAECVAPNNQQDCADVTEVNCPACPSLCTGQKVEARPAYKACSVIGEGWEECCSQTVTCYKEYDCKNSTETCQGSSNKKCHSPIYTVGGTQTHFTNNGVACP